MTLGMLPAEVMRQGAIHNAEREEYGWGHALAVIADCASLGEFYDGEVAVPTLRALLAAGEPVAVEMEGRPGHEVRMAVGESPGSVIPRRATVDFPSDTATPVHGRGGPACG
jgi:hypothetical protein